MKPLFLILASLLCLGQLFAQVGINNPNPSQTLDVSGKIKIGDDQITPVAGTIRYNRVAKTFEGYDGTEWSVFNPEEGGGGGDGSPASGTVVSTSRLISGPSPSFYWQYNPDGEGFLTVPGGRALYVTYISVKHEGAPYDLLIQAENNQGDDITRTQFHVSDDAPVRNQTFSEPNGHLIVVPSGHILTVNRLGGNASIFIRGFLQ